MIELYDHQKEAIELAKHKSLALFHDCGTGKTATGLRIIGYHKYRGDGPALVVCPLSIIDEAWGKDCAEFTPYLSLVSLWDKNPKKRLEHLQESRDIYVVNYETFKSMYKDIVKKGFRIVIADESTKIKSNKAAMTKAMLSLAGLGPLKSKYDYVRQMPIPYRYVLTGTPAPNDESEYWSQIKFVTGPGSNCFDDNFYRFREEYFRAIPLGLTGQYKYEFKESKRKQLLDAMKPYVHVVEKNVLNLPAQLPPQIRKVTLSSKERKAYNELKDDCVLQFANEQVLAESALTEIMKLRQITSGFCYGKDEPVHSIGRSKLRELKALLEEIGKNQVIIWCNFREEIKTLLRELPGSEALWADNKDKAGTIERFKGGKVQCLIAHPKSAAHGLTFVNCHYTVDYSLNYSYELFKQARERADRIGQKFSVVRYYLVAEHTIDEVIYKVLMKKGKISKEALEYLKA